MSCTACENIPVDDEAPGRVAAFAEAGHILAKVRTIASAHGAVLRQLENDVALLDFPSGRWAAFLGSLHLQTTLRERETLWLAPLPSNELQGLALMRAGLSAPTAEAWCARRELAWLTRCLALRKLTSHYQPIVDARSHATYAYEALVRGTGPDGNLVSAGTLIDGARRLDLLFALDQQSRESALRNAPPQSELPHRLFINFLPTVIYDPARCLATTWRALNETTYRPEDVVFEVVESESITNRNELCRILDHYRAEGFRVALDDLGAGYGSINLLSQLRPDYVKLDMELVRGAVTDHLRAGLVRAIAEVARNCGIEVIAEGIETAEQARFIAALGVHLMQGYYFARPASPSELRPVAVQELLAIA